MTGVPHHDQPPPLDWNGPTDHPFRPMSTDVLDRPVFDVFLEAVSRGADRPAVLCRRGTTTYAALAEQARRIAAALSAVDPAQRLVGVALPVDHRCVAAMLGALGAGVAYVPLDLQQPAERIAHIVRHSGLACVLACAETMPVVEGLVPPSCRTLDIDRLSPAPTSWQVTGAPTDVAYVLYTSGSTGRPKGVFQHQRGLMHDVRQYTHSVHFSERDVTSLLYSPGVNGAIRDIYGALLNGGCLCMLDLRRDGYTVTAAQMVAAGITIFHAMPPVLRSLLREVHDRSMLARVRLAYVAGDRFWGSDVRALRAALPAGSHLYTGIGSTECATLFRQWFVPPDWPMGDGLLPVGRAVPDRALRLVADDGSDVAQGEAGRILVRGRHLARGYWRDPELTAAVFMPDPDDTDMVTFHVGDRGRLREDGLLEFIGRADRQVKIRGYRVELAEVETALRAAPGVVDAAVVSAGEGDSCQLVGFAEMAHPSSAHREAVTAVLEQRLPTYMRPTRLVCTASLPRLGNGKLDMPRLTQMAAERNQAETTGTADLASGDLLTGRVLQEWRRVVGSAASHADSRWDESGGDSLRALELTVALENAFGITLPTDMLTADATPASLSRRVRAATDAVVVPTRQDAPLAALFILPGAGGASIQDRALADVLRGRFQVTLLSLSTLQDELTRMRSITEMARDGVEVIARTTAIGTPVAVLGVSFGARVAVDIACQLRRRGHRVVFVGVGDIPCRVEYVAPARPLPRRIASAWSRASGGVGIARAAWRFGAASAGAMMAGGLHAMARSRWQRLLRWTSRVGIMTLGDPCISAATMAVRRAQVQAWAIPRYPGELTLFRTDVTADLYASSGPTLGWEQHAESVRVVPVEGDHGTFLGPQYGPQFARRVLDVAIEACQREGQTAVPALPA